MGLTDIISDVMEGFEKRKDKQCVWEQLKKKLKKKGFKKIRDRVIDHLGSAGAYGFLEVWEALDEYLNQHYYDWDGSEGDDNLKAIETLSEINGIREVIKVLSEIGYEISAYKEEYKTLLSLSGSLQFFKMLAKDELYKKCALVFKALKKLDYKDIKSYSTSASTQLDYFIKIACLKEDATGAIYILANKGYKIDGAIGINKLDFNNIEKIIENGKEDIPIYLYNEGDTGIFQEYFNDLETEKKKSVLKSILEHETKTAPDLLIGPSERKQNREWLEKNYEGLIKELTFTS